MDQVYLSDNQNIMNNIFKNIWLENIITLLLRGIILTSNYITLF